MSDAAAPTVGPGGIGGPGLLEVDNDQASILLRRLLRHPIREVWAAITEPAQVEQWLKATVRREDFPGGAISMDHPNGLHATGRVVEWHPPRTYEYEWNLPPSPNLPRGEASIIRWELSPTAEGTLLVLSHRKLSRATGEVFVRGMPLLLERLSAHLGGRPMPEPPWLSRPSGRRDPA